MYTCGQNGCGEGGGQSIDMESLSGCFRLSSAEQEISTIGGHIRLVKSGRVGGSKSRGKKVHAAVVGY